MRGDRHKLLQRNSDWIEEKKNNLQKNGQAVDQVAQSGCGISVPTDTLNSTGQKPEQPNLTLNLGLPLRWRLNWVTSRDPFQPELSYSSVCLNSHFSKLAKPNLFVSSHKRGEPQTHFHPKW